MRHVGREISSVAVWPWEHTLLNNIFIIGLSALVVVAVLIVVLTGGDSAPKSSSKRRRTEKRKDDDGPHDE